MISKMFAQTVWLKAVLNYMCSNNLIRSFSFVCVRIISFVEDKIPTETLRPYLNICCAHYASNCGYCQSNGLKTRQGCVYIARFCLNCHLVYIFRLNGAALFSSFCLC